jgi:pSer/pThr/pTyr-binding forkhead associated (FHA) protein
MKLVFLEGTGHVRQVMLDPLGMVIGRGSAADLILQDPHASRQHCLIAQVAEDWQVEDLGSVNGVLVNGVRIADLQVLRPGDKLFVGSTELFFIEDRIDAVALFWRSSVPPTVRIPIPVFGG